ncbi:MAG TPA: preprotein translocase subunit SecE [Polyangia bacterium]|jgi:preprotein translocase subunit SecE|nr:preprotein translocase subunit SecE [Polyangia bacterium]
MGPNKFVHITFALAGLLAAFILSRATDWVWSYFAKPNDLVINLLAIVVAGTAALVAYRNERVFASIVDVTRELEKVTWPTRKETTAATIVVLVTVLISALILSGFDAIWAFFTNWFLR